MADRVTVIGWDGSPLTAAARSALSAATLVAGAAHHLALPEVPPTAERIRLGSLGLAARRIAGHRGTAVVFADGDPGFFGAVRTLRAPEHGLEVEVVPAVSAVAAAFARAGMPWDDAQVVVAHPRTLRRAVNVCRAHGKVAVLTSPGAGPAELALLLGGVHRTFVICEELGTAKEQVTVLTSDRVADHSWRDPNVVIVIGGQAAAAPAAAADPAWLLGQSAGHTGPRGWARPGAEGGEGESALLRAAQLARPARAPATSSGTSAPAPAPSPWRPPRSAPPSSRSTPTRTPAHAQLPPPATGAYRSRSSPGAHRTYWRTSPNPTSSASAAGSRGRPGRRRPPPRTDRQPRLHPRRGGGHRPRAHRGRLHRRVRAPPVGGPGHPYLERTGPFRRLPPGSRTPREPLARRPG